MQGVEKRCVWGRDALGLFDEMRVDEEEFDIGLGEYLLDTDAIEAGHGGGAIGIADRVVPEASGAIAALRHPDALGALAHVANVSRDGCADLGTDALIGAKERHVAVGGSTGDDVDEAGVVEVTEGLNNILIEGVEVFEGLREKMLPETGGFSEMVFSCLTEERLVFASGDNFAVEVVGKLGEEDGVGELFEQDGREIEIAVEADVVALKIFEDAQEGKVGLGRSLEEPLDAVRPSAMVNDVRQVCVQGEGEKSCRCSLGLCQNAVSSINFSGAA